MDGKPDAELVSDSLAGDREAFSALVRKYQVYAYGVAISTVSDFDLARDVVQEAFLCA
jgi:DNA-directed RNA polymerase specialized sigma24 family protein